MRTSLPRPSLATLPATLAPWLVGGVIDIYATLGRWPAPLWWQFAVEIAFLLAAGVAQWRLTHGWWRSPLMAPAVFLFYASLMRAPIPFWHLVPFMLGVIVFLLWVVYFAQTRIGPGAWVASALAATIVLGSRYFDAVDPNRPNFSAMQSFVGELTWPLRSARAIAANATGPPLVVISVDTLRWDAALKMKTVQRLRARGAFWERAMSSSNWTLPALASLQTGLMPVEHGAGCLPGGRCQGLLPQVPLLAEQLQALGYATAAFVSNPWVTPSTGFDRGFQTFVEAGQITNRLLIAGVQAGPNDRDGMHVVDAALDWLATAPARGIYMWVHLLDPHLGYLHSKDPNLRALRSDRIRTSLPLTPDQQDEIRRAYADEVGYADRQLLRLLDALERRGILDDGVIVFTSDHGEEFWEHGGFEHTHSHHGEVVDIPLVLVAPGLAPGTRSGVASIIDVPSTLRAVVGLDPGGIDLRDGVPEGRIAAAWGGVVMHVDCSARDARWRAIVRDCSEEVLPAQVFDLRIDPQELRPLAHAGDNPVLLAARLVRPPKQSAATAQLDSEARRMLGYDP